MPPIVISGVVKVTTTWTFGGAPWAQNVHHYANLGSRPINQAEAELFDATYKAQFVASALDDFVPVSFALDHIDLLNLDIANQPTFTGSGPPQAGTFVGDPLPLQTCLVATFRTSLAGRRFRGRHYQGGWAENATTTLGTASNAAQLALQTFLVQIQTDVGNEGYEPVVASVGARDAMGVLIPPSAQFVIATVVRDGIWDVQRRRRDVAI